MADSAAIVPAGTARYVSSGRGTVSLLTIRPMTCHPRGCNIILWLLRHLTVQSSLALVLRPWSRPSRGSRARLPDHPRFLVGRIGMPCHVLPCNALQCKRAAIVSIIVARLDMAIEGPWNKRRSQLLPSADSVAAHHGLTGLRHDSLTRRSIIAIGVALAACDTAGCIVPLDPSSLANGRPCSLSSILLCRLLSFRRAQPLTKGILGLAPLFALSRTYPYRTVPYRPVPASCACPVLYILCRARVAMLWQGCFAFPCHDLVSLLFGPAFARP